MPKLREVHVIATELETHQLQDWNFRFSLPSKNAEEQNPSLADVTNTHKSGVQQQSTNSCQRKITRSDQNLQDTYTCCSDSDFETVS